MSKMRLSPFRARGQALVEFALVLPVLLLLVLGVVEFGRAWMVRNVVTNAAREGARAGIILGATASEVQSAVDNYLLSAGLVEGSAVEMGGVGPDVAPGTATWVEVSYGLQTFAGSFIPGWSGAITVSHRAVMRHE